LHYFITLVQHCIASYLAAQMLPALCSTFGSMLPLSQRTGFAAEMVWSPQERLFKAYGMVLMLFRAAAGLVGFHILLLQHSESILMYYLMRHYGIGCHVSV
jgi:hypothetical protein